MTQNATVHILKLHTFSKFLFVILWMVKKEEIYLWFGCYNWMYTFSTINYLEKSGNLNVIFVAFINFYSAKLHLWVL